MKRLDLSRLSGKFIRLVNRYMKDNNMTQKDLAEFVGMQRPHLNSLLNQSPDRPLSGHYVLHFIRKGVFKVADIRDRKVVSKKEQEFWDMASEAENVDLLAGLAELRKRGVDVEALIKRELKKTK